MRILRITLAAVAIFAAVLLVTSRSGDDTPSNPPPDDGNSQWTLGRSPSTRTVVQVDPLHGVRVSDPYRWLENESDPEVGAWIDAQNAHTERFLEHLGTRERIAAILDELSRHEQRSVPEEAGGRTFFTRRSEGQEQAILYATREGGEATVVFDPNEMPSGEVASLAGWWPSPDGRLVACAVSSKGSDEVRIHVRDVESGAVLPDDPGPLKYTSAAWDRKSEGFWFMRFAPHAQIVHHRLGDAKEDDAVVFERPEMKRWFLGASASNDGRWLQIGVSRGSGAGTGLFLLDLEREDARVEPFLTSFDARWSVIGNQGTWFWFWTNRGAPRGSVVAIDYADPARKAVSVIDASPGTTMLSAHLIAGRLVTHDLDESISRLSVFALSGKRQGTIELPGEGSVGDITGEPDGTTVTFSFQSWTQPPSILRHDFTTGTTAILESSAIDGETPRVERTEYTSADGTRVPITIIRPAGEASGPRPTLLYGYGGFNIPQTSRFRWNLLGWVRAGGVVAVAHLRGGGERGTEWHHAGRLLKKQNVFDDFISAAEWLIEDGVTTRAQLAVYGRSNGGLLIGACLLQRPDLFGAALCEVGVLDMMRYHLFTAGRFWVPEYGDVDDPAQFRAMFAYSPVHNVKSGTEFPPTMVATSFGDDRVVPLHSYKFAAALQAAQAGDAPILLRVQRGAGHGSGRPRAMRVAETADQWAFLMDAVGLVPSVR